MRAADFIVDVGPRAGRKGGRIVASGSFDDILRSDSITADYLTGRRRIEIPASGGSSSAGPGATTSRGSPPSSRSASSSA